MAYPMRSGKAGGFIYIGLIIGVAIVGISLGAVSEVWTQSRQREKERELIFAGNQIRQAITQYYLASPPANRRFPNQLEELLEDVRTPDKTGRYLRRIYVDPMTSSNKWGEARLPSGQLVGVYSLSDDAPIKQAGFALRDKNFNEKARYSEWVFRSPLPAANPLLEPDSWYMKPGSKIAQPGSTAPRETRPPTPTPPGVILPMPRRR